MLKNQSHFKHDIVDKLSKYVIGQNEPKIALARALENLNNPLFKKKGPLYKALYYGQTGSGKTEMVKALARVLFDDEYGYTHVSCENMQHGHEISKLFGAPPGFIGSEKEAMFSERNLYSSYESAQKSGRLMEGLKGRGAMSIILFDEIEKAHRDISQALMSVLDEGMIYLNNGKKVDIGNSFVLMTSNIGESNIKNIATPVGFNSNINKIDIDGVRDGAVKKHFSPEFLGRMDGLYRFEKIEGEGLYKVLSKLLKDLDEDVKRLWKSGVKFSLSNEAKKNIVDNSGNSIRDMERYFNNNVRNKLGNIINSNGLYGIEQKVIIEIDYEDGFIFNGR